MLSLFFCGHVASVVLCVFTWAFIIMISVLAFGCAPWCSCDESKFWCVSFPPMNAYMCNVFGFDATPCFQRVSRHFESVFRDFLGCIVGRRWIRVVQVEACAMFLVCVVVSVLCRVVWSCFRLFCVRSPFKLQFSSFKH